MNKKRALSILMAAAMAAGTLVTSVPVYADDVEEITWMFWDDLEATEDLVSKGYKDVIDRFNTEYEGKYHVTPITTNLEEYDGKLNALIAAGQTPDVYICNPGPNMDVYVNAGAAADLTDILENQEKDWYATFTDGIFDRLTYDGKIMAVPTNFAAAFFFYSHNSAELNRYRSRPPFCNARSRRSSTPFRDFLLFSSLFRFVVVYYPIISILYLH